MDNSVLNIMFYGVYNVGKSILINVFLGKEVVFVVDIFKIDKVDCYFWGDYILLDMLGVNVLI